MKKITNKLLAGACAKQLEIGRILNHKRKGDFAADKGVVIAITVALAGIALVVAVALLKDTIGPMLTNAIKGFFNFS